MLYASKQKWKTTTKKPLSYLPINEGECIVATRGAIGTA